MATCYFISHPEVAVDPLTPVPDWGLSVRGAARMRLFGCAPLLDHVVAIWASPEEKARQAAVILSGLTGLKPAIHEDLRENDRSATGFLPPDAFSRAADAFFAAPEVSFRGWERAIDAQRRIVAAVESILAATDTGDGDLAIIGHGGTGTLLYCHLAGIAIDRRHDQPGQGHFFAFDLATRQPRHGWRAFEAA
jgi:broad specificity phosphatase PhoE